MQTRGQESDRSVHFVASLGVVRLVRASERVIDDDDVKASADDVLADRAREEPATLDGAPLADRVEVLRESDPRGLGEVPDLAALLPAEVGVKGEVAELTL